MLLEKKGGQGLEIYSNSCNCPKGQKGAGNGVKPDAKQKVNLHFHSQTGHHAGELQSTTQPVCSPLSYIPPAALISALPSC